MNRRMHGSDSVLSARVRHELSERGLGVREFERLCGLNERAVLGLLSRTTKNPRIDTVQKIASGLGMTVSDLLGETASARSELRPVIFVALVALLNAMKDQGVDALKHATSSDIDLLSKHLVDGAFAQLAGEERAVAERLDLGLKEIHELRVLRSH